MLELSTWAVKRKSCPANCCPLVHLVIAKHILYKHVRSGPWYHDRKLYDIYCKNMFVLVRGIKLHDIYCTNMFVLVRGNSRTFRRSAASGPRTDYKCCAMCVMIGPWYHDPSLFSFFLLTLFGVSCRDNLKFF